MLGIRIVNALSWVALKAVLAAAKAVDAADELHAAVVDAAHQLRRTRKP
jgi:hypothetical protein